MINNECPICLEDNKNTPEMSMVEFGCSHGVCLQCLLHMMGVSSCRGTLVNIMAHAIFNIEKKRAFDYSAKFVHYKCPICRHKISPGKCSSMDIDMYACKTWEIQ